MIFRDSMNYLEARGHNVKVFNAVVKNAKVDEKYRTIMDEKVIHRECFSSNDRFIFPLKQWKIKKAIDCAINYKEIDVIHSHTLFNGGWATRSISKEKGIPYVVTVRNTDMNDYLPLPGFKLLARIIVRDAAQIQFLSEAYRQAFIEKCFPNERNYVMDKSAVITNGLEPFWLDNIWLKERSVCGKKVNLLCVGKIDSNKNMKAVLEAAGILEKRGFIPKVTIIGQVVDQQIESEIRNYSGVEVLPFMKKEELIEYYRAADIYVMPSFTESFGRVYAEAMTQGLPVIYTRGQGFDGQFSDGLVGYAVSPTDYEQIADCIVRIYDNYEVIHKNCVKLCIHYDWKQIAESLETMYEKAVTGKD